MIKKKGWSVLHNTKLHTFVFDSLLSQSQCMSGTPCSHDLTNQLMTKLKDMGLPKVEGAAYSVLVSHPVLTIPSTLRTMDGDGNVMETVTLYGQETVNDTTEKPSSGNTSNGKCFPNL